MLFLLLLLLLLLLNRLSSLCSFSWLIPKSFSPRTFPFPFLSSLNLDETRFTSGYLSKNCWIEVCWLPRLPLDSVVSSSRKICVGTKRRVGGGVTTTATGSGSSKTSSELLSSSKSSSSSSLLLLLLLFKIKPSKFEKVKNLLKVCLKSLKC